MAAWLHRTRVEYIPRLSPSKMLARFPTEGPFVDASGNAASNAQWIFNPKNGQAREVKSGVSDVTGFAPKYWTVTGDIVSLKSPAERAAVDAAEAAAITAAHRTSAADMPDSLLDLGIEIRGLIELLNKRDNYQINRITELQDAMDAMKASVGAADSIRAAIPASWLATATRTKADAVTDYKDDVNAGNQDVP